MTDRLRALLCSLLGHKPKSSIYHGVRSTRTWTRCARCRADLGHTAQLAPLHPIPRGRTVDL